MYVGGGGRGCLWGKVALFDPANPLYSRSSYSYFCRMQGGGGGGERERMEMGKKHSLIGHSSVIQIL